MTEKLISIIVPCFNERDNILPLIKAINEAMMNYKCEIVVVDDQSPDGTFEIVNKAALPNTRVLSHQGQPSLGASIRMGIEHAQGEIIVVMDSDFNHRPSDIPVLVDNVKYYDCVLASRFVYGGSMGNRFRHLSSWFFNIFIRMLTSNYVTDSLFGFFAIKKTVLERVRFDDVFWGFGDYAIRLFYYLQKQNISILQIPGVLGRRPFGEGNRRFVRTLLVYTMATLQLVLKARKYSIKEKQQNV